MVVQGVLAGEQTPGPHAAAGGPHAQSAPPQPSRLLFHPQPPAPFGRQSQQQSVQTGSAVVVVLQSHGGAVVVAGSPVVLVVVVVQLTRGSTSPVEQ